MKKVSSERKSATFFPVTTQWLSREELRSDYKDDVIVTIVVLRRETFPNTFLTRTFRKKRDGRRPFVTKILQTSFCRTFCNPQWLKINQNVSFEFSRQNHINYFSKHLNFPAKKVKITKHQLFVYVCAMNVSCLFFLAKARFARKVAKWDFFESFSNTVFTSKIHFYSSFSYRNYEAKRFEMVATEGYQFFGFDDHIADMELFALFCKETKTQWYGSRFQFWSCQFLALKTTLRNATRR